MEPELEKKYNEVHKKFFLGQEIFRRSSVELLFWKIDELEAAQQSVHWTAGIVRRFKHFPVVKFVLSLWHSLAIRQ